MSQIEKKNKTLTTIQKEKIESLKSKKKEFGRKQSERRKGRDYREGKTGSTLGERNDCHTWTQCVERLHSVARPSFFPLRQSSRLSVCVCVCVCIIQREFVYAHVNLWPPVLDSILRNFPAGWCGRPSRTAYVSRCRVCRLSKNDQCNPAIVGGGGDRRGGRRGWSC